MTNVHVFCFFASYVIALALEGGRLSARSNVLRGLSLAFAFAGLVAHSLYLVNRSNEVHLPPLLSSSHDWLLVLAWTAVVFFLILSIFDRDLPVGLFLLPAVLILIGAASLVGTMPTRSQAIDPEAFNTAKRNWSMLHASLLIFGIGGVMIGFVFSLMYLVQHRRLKQKHSPQGGFTLPSLATLARLNWWSVIVSVPLLTLGMLTGVPLVYLGRSTPVPISFSDPLIVGSAIVWLVMIVFFGWLLRADHVGGRQIAWRTLWAFGFLLVTILGLQVLSGGHVPSASRTAWTETDGPAES